MVDDRKVGRSVSHHHKASTVAFIILILVCTFAYDIPSSSSNIEYDNGSKPALPHYLSYFVNIHPVVDRSSTEKISRHLNDSENNNDIDPHNKICRNYLKSFLEGTTDTNDECQGLQNAYSAADCQEDINLVSMVHENQKNDTGSDDDKTSPDVIPAIDDFFQEFQCEFIYIVQRDMILIFLLIYYPFCHLR